MAVFAGFISFGAFAQADAGGQTYRKAIKVKKAKKAKKAYAVASTRSAERKAINTRHRTVLKNIHSNDILTNEQQRELKKQANAAHKQEIKNTIKPTGKKK